MAPEWHKQSIIYELHVRSFCDSNADGIGDFPGLSQKLDYLQQLGVNCLWLSPVCPSPLRDDGYDIADFFNVHPDYGTLEQFEAFVKNAHERHLRVILELVLNHTSDQHPWFQAARQSRDSEFHDYYVWADDTSCYGDAAVLLAETELSNWTWDTVAHRYFFHRFFSHEPQLNYANPRVRHTMMEAVLFWLARGADGIRCDGLPYLFLQDGTGCEDLPETHAFARELRAAVNRRYPSRVLLAGINRPPGEVRDYFGNGDEFHAGYHFGLTGALLTSLRSEDRGPVAEAIAATPDIPEGCAWAIFLRNHDDFGLQSLVEHDRDYLYSVYAPDPRMRVRQGIRRRLAPMLDNGRKQIELLNGLLMTLQGTPVLYYGDELGMGDNIYLGTRNAVRTPMQWNSDRNAGFSRADADRVFCPVVTSPLYGYVAVNVEAQLRVPTSLLNWMKRIVSLRQRHKALSRGSFRLLTPRNKRILAFVRQCEDETMLIVCNLSRYAQPAALDLREFAGATPVEPFGGVEFPPITTDTYDLALTPHGFYWFLLSGAPAAGPAAGMTS